VAASFNNCRYGNLQAIPYILFMKSVASLHSAIYHAVYGMVITVEMRLIICTTLTLAIGSNTIQRVTGFILFSLSRFT